MVGKSSCRFNPEDNTSAGPGKGPAVTHTGSPEGRAPGMGPDTRGQVIVEGNVYAGDSCPVLGLHHADGLGKRRYKVAVLEYCPVGGRTRVAIGQVAREYNAVRAAIGGDGYGPYAGLEHLIATGKISSVDSLGRGVDGEGSG